VHHLILSPDVTSLALTPDQLATAARERWGTQMFVTGRTGPEVSLELEVTGPPHRFSICLSARGDSIFTDGSWEQTAQVAAWVRSLIPDGFGYRLWLADESFSGHATLPPGVQADQLADLWVDHAKEGYPPLPGWSSHRRL
jgi:hypothetical protein